MARSLCVNIYLTIILSGMSSISMNTVSEDYPTLLLGNRANIQLISASQPENIKQIVDNIGYTMSCDYIYSDNLIFWMDSASGQGKIQCAYTNVSHSQRVKHDVIRTGLVQPEGLACDWISKKLYWTDADTDRIEVSDLEGRMRKVIIWNQLDQPRAIAVDPLNGYMYWTDWGTNSKIERAGMDGSNRQILVEKDGIYWPNGLTIDYNEGKVYWVDANYDYITRMNTDGSGREVVVSNGPSNAGHNAGNWDSQTDVSEGSLQHPFAITLSGNRIYWTDWSTNSIHSAPKNGSGQTQVVKENISSLHDIHSYGPHRQKKGNNPCGMNNGGCSHLCLISPSPPYYTCACPTGVQIKPDRKTCKDGPVSILLLARRPDLRVISLDTPDFTDIVLPLANVKMAVAVEYDPVDDMVYWTNNVKKAIFRAKLDGEGEEKIVSDEIEQCDGLAVDWVARNLYWAEAGRNYIAVSRLNGTSRKTIIEKGVEKPRALVLDPAMGQMYWSDWGNEAKIERASLDGTDRYVFINTSIVWPNGLAIDYNKRLLYWAEAYLDKIEVIGLNGTGRRVLLEEKIPHIFGFSLLDDYLYWSDWEKRKVERMLVDDRQSRHSMINELPDLMGIKASRVDPLPATNPCAKNNGGCSHLCLFTPKGPKCNCPDGQALLPDMKSCIEPEAFLLFTLSTHGVRRISLETAPSINKEVPFENKVDAIHMDVSVEDDAIYWTDTEQMQIFRSYMNGTGVTKLIHLGLRGLEGIAIDWLGRNIYWADSSTNRIEMARLDSTSRRPVVWQGLQTPLSVAVDPVEGYIYWSEWCIGKPLIRRAQMDGSKVETLLGNGEIGRANSLTIDYDTKRLYWVDLDANEIMSSNMTGGQRTQIVAGMDKPIFTMTIYKDYIYWTKGNSIERANKTTGNERSLIQSSDQSILDMLVYHASRQSGVSACSHVNGGCQHICLSVPGGTHKCACPAHYKLQKDNQTCTSPQTFLLFSQEQFISRLVFERGTSGKQSPDAVLPIAGLLRACSIDYDPVEDYVYWIDCDIGAIKKSRMNGTQMTTLLDKTETLDHPYDLAIDPYGRMVYWTDSRNNSINVMRMDGTIIGAIARETVRLVGTGGSNNILNIIPRKIAVHPENGYLFFSTACDDPACRVMILRMELDGSNCLILFSKGLKKVSGLAVDNDAKKLYWADEELKKIDSSFLDGSSHTPFFDMSLMQPGSITIFGPNVYWIDQKANGWQIEAARKNGGHHKVIQTNVQDVLDIVGVTEISRKSITEHPCGKGNGRCSHICVGKDDGTARCSCPTHLTLIDDLQCGETPTCQSDEFTCVSGDIPCIPENWRCDGGVGDCKDGSDEENCPACNADSFHCGTGVGGTEEETARATEKISNRFWGLTTEMRPEQCVPIKQRCDGVEHCLDGSDEMNCKCQPNEFLCLSGKCVSDNSACDCLDPSCGVTSTPASSQDSTLIIIIISIICSAVIVAIIIFTFKRRRSARSNHHCRSAGTVTFTQSGCMDGGFHVNLEVTSHGDHVSQVNHHGSDATHPVKPTKKGSGGRSTSLNLSILPPKGPTQMVNAHMPPPSHNRAMLPGAHASYGAIPYPGPYSVTDPMMLPNDPPFHKRPNVPGASSSSSSSRASKQYPPTLNPPPSPATDRSGSKSTGECPYSSDSPSNRSAPYYRCRNGHRHSRSHRYRPHMQGAPPPTPCTSDTCDDVMSYHSAASRCSKSGGPPSTPPPSYWGCYHYYPPYHAYGGGYMPYPPPSSYHSSHHGYHRDHHHHSSSSSGSAHMAPPECRGPCCHGGSGRHHYSPSGRSSRAASYRHPPRYNPMSSDLNSDSDPSAPPPTPRSHYMSDCCYTHDEGDDNQDEETGSDPPRFINQVDASNREEDEDAGGDAKESDPLVAASSPAKNSAEPESLPEGIMKKTFGEDQQRDENERSERESLLPPGQEPSTSPSNMERSYRNILNPPPSPVTERS